MQIEQRTWTEVHGWTPDFSGKFCGICPIDPGLRRSICFEKATTI